MTYLPELRRALVEAASALTAPGRQDPEPATLAYLPQLRAALVGAAASLPIQPALAPAATGTGGGAVSRRRERGRFRLFHQSLAAPLAMAAVAIGALAFVGEKLALSPSSPSQSGLSAGGAPRGPAPASAAPATATGAAGQRAARRHPHGVPNRVASGRARTTLHQGGHAVTRLPVSSNAPRERSAKHTPEQPKRSTGTRKAAGEAPATTTVPRTTKTPRPNLKTKPPGRKTKAPKGPSSPLTKTAAPEAVKVVAETREPKATEAPATGTTTTGPTAAEGLETTPPTNEVPTTTGVVVEKKKQEETKAEEEAAADKREVEREDEREASVPTGVRGELLEDARKSATQSGDSHPSDIEAVGTTGSRAEALLGVSTPNVAANASVYVIAMRGAFTYSRSINGEAGEGEASATVMLIEIQGTEVVAVHWNDTYPDLASVGTPVEL